jgi:hypothetical protein
MVRTYKREQELSCGSTRGGDHAATEEKQAQRAPLRKTKFCMFHLQGVCQFGDSCGFAHSVEEMQGSPDLSKTHLESGPCTDQKEELPPSNPYYKHRLCLWHEKGCCRKGEECRFAHGVEELRTHDSRPKAPKEKREESQVPATTAIRAHRERPGDVGSPAIVNGVPGAAVRGAPGLERPQRYEPMFVQPSSPMSTFGTCMAPPGLAALPPPLEQQPQGSHTGLEKLAQDLSALTMHMRRLEMQMAQQPVEQEGATDSPGIPMQALIGCLDQPMNLLPPGFTAPNPNPYAHNYYNTVAWQGEGFPLCADASLGA